MNLELETRGANTIMNERIFKSSPQAEPLAVVGQPLGRTHSREVGVPVRRESGSRLRRLKLPRGRL